MEATAGHFPRSCRHGADTFSADASFQKTNPLKRLAGAGGFEPPYGGIKIRCLTTWLRPNRQQNTVARAIPEGICLTGAV